MITIEKLKIEDIEDVSFLLKEKECSYSILVSSNNRSEAHKFYEKMGFNDDVRGFRKFYI